MFRKLPFTLSSAAPAILFGYRRIQCNLQERHLHKATDTQVIALKKRIAHIQKLHPDQFWNKPEVLQRKQKELKELQVKLERMLDPEIRALPLAKK